MESDRRKYPRTEVSEPGVICSGGWNTRCVVRNWSVEGAAIDVDDVSQLPGEFVLMLGCDRRTFNCRTVWTAKGRIGVSLAEQLAEQGEATADTDAKA